MLVSSGIETTNRRFESEHQGPSQGYVCTLNKGSLNTVRHMLGCVAQSDCNGEQLGRAHNAPG
jgi:hypothetical protein